MEIFMLSALLQLPQSYTPAANGLQKGLMAYSGINNEISTLARAAADKNKPLTEFASICYFGYRFFTNKTAMAKIPLTKNTNLGFNGGKNNASLNLSLGF